MIEKTERIGFVSREGFEIELPVIQWGNATGTGHPDHAVRPEKTAVGVYHPPLPIYFLNPELTCCLELWAIGPAAPAVPLGRARIIRQLLFFRNSGLLQILVTVDFTLPVSVHVLSVPVHKREELTPVHLHDSRDPALARQERDIGNDVFHILVTLHRRNGYVTDITQIQIIGKEIQGVGIRSAPHKRECIIHLRMRHFRGKSEFQTQFLQGSDFVHGFKHSPDCLVRTSAELLFGRTGIENVTAEINRMNGIPVLDNKAYRPVGAKVPVSIETDSGGASGRLHGENISVAADDTPGERLRLETISGTEDQSCSVLWYSRRHRLAEE